jgi:hypothetical protein
MVKTMQRFHLLDVNPASPVFPGLIRIAQLSEHIERSAEAIHFVIHDVIEYGHPVQPLPLEV